MDLDPSVVWDFAGTLVGTLRERPRQLPATVSRVDPDGTVWLSMPGAEGLVPASTTADVQADDSVTVEWWGNAYHVTGNGTSPSVGTRAAAALRRATAAAAKVAGEAKGIADAVGQHFWADDNGVHVSNEDGNATGERNILMNSLGILLRKGSAWLASFSDSATAFYDGLGNAAANIVAQFGADGAVIGRSNESHQVFDYHSLQLVDKEGKSYFHVSDLRDHSGTAEITVVFTGDGSKRTFSFDSIYPDDTSYTVTVSDGSGGTPTKSRYNFMFLSAPSDGATISATYKTSSTLAKAYTAGLRHTDEGGHANIGAMSFAEGYDITSSGGFAHSEGAQTVASSYAAHSEGVGSTASQLAAHAEGWFTKASGYYSHAEGWHSVAKGNRSHAQNEWTIADYEDQTAMGRFNANSADHALEIGNGTYDDARSNALAVGWDGTVTHDGDVPWTNLTLTSDVVAFSNGQVPMYRKWGPVVTLCGAVKMASAQSAGFTVQISQLPVGCRPRRDLMTLCQGSNNEVWLLGVYASGVVSASRYRRGDTSVAVATTTWFPFTVTFLVA